MVSNQKKRNIIVNNAQAALFTSKAGIREISKKKSTYGLNTLKNMTRKSINSIQKHINSELFKNSPINRKMLTKYRNQQISALGKMEKSEMIILQKNNINRLKKQQQNREINNLRRRLAKLKA